MKVISFKRKWASIKKELTDRDLHLFYEIIHNGDYIDRVLTCSGRDFNPIYMSHYFPVCRCHKNVVFPTILLNNGELENGTYKIITNDKHSAIVNTKTNKIYDPTYDANGVDLSNTMRQFAEEYKIISIYDHMRSC